VFLSPLAFVGVAEVDYILKLIKQTKSRRKLKVSFSSLESPLFFYLECLKHMVCFKDSKTIL
jgi:hypothetical protein